tara:strand:- start:362 stop:610 length:249 start_codon:yes stop_codon:yes gene_type:complete
MSISTWNPQYGVFFFVLRTFLIDEGFLQVLRFSFPIQPFVVKEHLSKFFQYHFYLDILKGNMLSTDFFAWTFSSKDVDTDEA